MMTALTELIEEWATDRNLHTADPAKQMLKLGEEFGELCQGMAKNKPNQIEDSIGDMYVVMTILSIQLGLDIDDCVLGAYNEIKDRRGKMVNGVFVKESDLKEEAEVEKCEWSRESDDVWRSDCGLLWEFDNEETPKANNMNYCPQCGKILEEAPECWEEAE